jgi:hypothetical protein
MNAIGYVTLLILGAISFVLLLAQTFLFGKLNWLQFRIWLLAKKGYHMVEHIGLDKVRNYFYLKPDNNKFDFKKGFYMHIPEATTKIRDGLIKQTNRAKFMVRTDDAALDANQYQKLKDTAEKFVYSVDAVTLRWGIPTITYVGKNPYPIIFSEPERQMGAQVLKDMYLRIVATQQYEWAKKMITIGLIVVAANVLVLLALWFVTKGNASNLGFCQANLNDTGRQLLDCVNSTARMMAQNSTIIV